jgi:hypothetical protein
MPTLTPNLRAAIREVLSQTPPDNPENTDQVALVLCGAKSGSIISTHPLELKKVLIMARDEGWPVELGEPMPFPGLMTRKRDAEFVGAFIGVNKQITQELKWLWSGAWRKLEQELNEQRPEQTKKSILLKDVNERLGLLLGYPADFVKWYCAQSAADQRGLPSQVRDDWSPEEKRFDYCAHPDTPEAWASYRDWLQSLVYQLMQAYGADVLSLHL